MCLGRILESKMWIGKLNSLESLEHILQLKQWWKVRGGTSFGCPCEPYYTVWPFSWKKLWTNEGFWQRSFHGKYDILSVVEKMDQRGKRLTINASKTMSLNLDFLGYKASQSNGELSRSIKMLVLFWGLVWVE